MRLVTTLAAVLELASLPCATPPRFAVENKCPAFVVENKCPATSACPNCATCGTGCACWGGGFYCADGKCPVRPVTWKEEVWPDTNGRPCRWLWPSDYPRSRPQFLGFAPAAPPAAVNCPPFG